MYEIGGVVPHVNFERGANLYSKTQKLIDTYMIFKKDMNTLTFVAYTDKYV